MTGLLVHLGGLMGLAFAEPLVEDELEDGSVPMYGQEVYPEVPTPSETEALPVGARGEVPETSFTEPVPAPKPAPVPEPAFTEPEPAPKPGVSEPVIPEVAPEPPMQTLSASKPGPRPGIPYNQGTRDQGWADGRGDAEGYVRVGPTLIPSVGAGAIVPVCGCVGASLIAAVVPVNEPGTDAYRSGSDAYQDGYLEGYRSGVRRQRVTYTVLGGAIGTSVTVFLLINV